MKNWHIIPALVAFCATVAIAAPTDVLTGTMSPVEEGVLERRWVSCSNGIAVNCGGASTSCSGFDCLVCCGSCCKKVRAPEDNSCNAGTKVVKVKCK